MEFNFIKEKCLIKYVNICCDKFVVMFLLCFELIELGLCCVEVFWEECFFEYSCLLYYLFWDLVYYNMNFFYFL